MAGITYTLRKLGGNKDNLLNVCLALTYSVFISSGSWLFTTSAVGIILVLGPSVMPFSILREFQILIVYNFSIAYALIGFFSLVVCRDISDRIYMNQLEGLSGVFIGSLCLLYLISLPIAITLYGALTIFDIRIVLAAISNLLLLLCIYHASIFLSTLKEYKTISFSFLLGMIVSATASIYLGDKGFGTAGVLNGFNIGLVLIAGILVGLIVHEYPPAVLKPLSFLKSYKKYWALVASGIVCNLGIWIDKWIMWFSPNSVKYPSGLVCDLSYSNATFLGYLTIIPAMTYFLFSIEYWFDKEILRFYNSITSKATLSQILAIKKDVIKALIKCILGYLFVQGVFTLIAIFMSVKILKLLNIPLIQLSIFKFAVIGAFYQFFYMFLVSVLFYLDQKKSVLLIYLIFLILNAGLTVLSIHMGFRYYGIGFFIASLITFFVSAIIVAVKIKNLEYHAFITSNL